MRAHKCWSVVLAWVIAASGIGAAGTSAVAFESAPAETAAIASVSQPIAPVMQARMVKGTRSTGRYVPKAFAYNTKVPTLQGASVKSKSALDRTIDSLIGAELAFYAKAALAQDAFNTSLKSPEAAITSIDMWFEWCHTNLKDLTGTFSPSVYRGRYASHRSS
ncbi:MAG: hypothetical protein LBK28_02725 [Propionibacteriaceae bacterium]|jgi:hypothetical protein|nr:hypothetical protein [Propionibacteriaceae bacterium]